MEEKRRDDELFAALQKAKKRKRVRRVVTVLVIVGIIAGSLAGVGAQFRAAVDAAGKDALDDGGLVRTRAGAQPVGQRAQDLLGKLPAAHQPVEPAGVDRHLPLEAEVELAALKIAAGGKDRLERAPGDRPRVFPVPFRARTGRKNSFILHVL